MKIINKLNDKVNHLNDVQCGDWFLIKDSSYTGLYLCAEVFYDEGKVEEVRCMVFHSDGTTYFKNYTKGFMLLIQFVDVEIYMVDKENK